MNGIPQTDLFYENPSSRSPRSANYPTQSLNRQNSRQFPGFDQQNGLYGMDDLTSRFDAPRYNDRMNTNMQNNYAGYDGGMPQAWNSSTFGHTGNNANFGTMNTNTRRSAARPARSALPPTWMDQSQPVAQGGYGGAFGAPPFNMPPNRQEMQGSEDDDLIPTAIVIKNIPFAVKKEQLMDVMASMGLPLPYAFNYHFDNGVFRGLAFANFTSPDETQLVIQQMNHMDLNGRKLRVEYKKMLPQAERDRIEREKRERRGQLEEQHRPLPQPSLQPQASLNSMVSGVHARSPSPGTAGNSIKLDMNDPVTLQYFTELLVFQTNQEQGDVKDFPPTLHPTHRRILHGLAHNLGLGHSSEGSGNDRHIRIYRNPAQSGPGSANVPIMHQTLDPNRRGLYRAATTDFTDVRDPNVYGPSRQSSGYLGYSESAGSLSAGANLRTAKSHADLRSYTPSPAQSAASFPAGLRSNIAQYTDYPQGQNSPISSRSAATPTTAAMQGNSETMLINGLGNMSLGGGFNNTGGSPHQLRGMVSWEREGGQAPGPVGGQAPGPIGGHRAFSANHDDSSRSRTSAAAPSRQPRGPALDRGQGFSRGRQNGHNSRGSDELSPTQEVDNLVD